VAPYPLPGSLSYENSARPRRSVRDESAANPEAESPKCKQAFHVRSSARAGDAARCQLGGGDLRWSTMASEPPQGPAWPAKLLVLERQGTWARALRRELPQLPVGLVECRAWTEVERLLGDYRGSAVAVELRCDNALTAASHLTRLRRRFPAALFVVLLTADEFHRQTPQLFRELGIAWLSDSPRRLRATAQLVARHLANAPAEPNSLVGKILADLPWASATDEDYP